MAHSCSVTSRLAAPREAAQPRTVHRWSWSGLLCCVYVLVAPSVACAEVARYTASPATFRSIAGQVLKAGAPAEITCTPGDYPMFLRSGAAFVGFKAPVVFKCHGATFPASSISEASNLIFDGGTFTGRLIVANFSNVTLRNLDFPQGAGVMGRKGSNFTVEGLSIDKSGAAIALLDVTNALVRKNKITDFSGNAGIAAYGGGDIRIIENIVTGERRVAEGVHPDGIQTANDQTGTVEISYNTVILPGQGIFAGGVPDLFIAKGNVVQVDFPNALTWKSRRPAQIGGNTISKLPSPLSHKPRMINYGLREGLAATEDLGGNKVSGAKTKLK